MAVVAEPTQFLQKMISLPSVCTGTKTMFPTSSISSNESTYTTESSPMSFVWVQKCLSTFLSNHIKIKQQR